jgi:hypothetical protein
LKLALLDEGDQEPERLNVHAKLEGDAFRNHVGTLFDIELHMMRTASRLMASTRSSCLLDCSCSRERK